MELRQLEYFTVVCEQGNFSKAAKCLYTSQPNVSKVVRSLENELGSDLLERGGRVLKVTPYGKSILEYTRPILKHAGIIKSMASDRYGKKFCIASYPSGMIARLLTEFYDHWGENYVVEHQEGSVEEICCLVEKGRSEIGIIYLAQSQRKTFSHILSHKKLKFTPLSEKPACIYVGPKHPRYQDDAIDFSDISSLKFIRGIHDYFSAEIHMEQVSLGVVGQEDLNYAMYSNSDHVTVNALLHTDMCSLGVNLMDEKYALYDIRALKINHCEPFLSVGYVQPETEKLGEASRWFLRKFTQLL